ncbi:MAG: helix-turn-helix domain-containing protein [Acidimicrobiaceae bacterium]|nr:helix-turn-helix domain-containing protein [Acidimicrobiaceae bacterium]
MTEQIEPGTYSLPEAARRLGIGVATIYELNRRGEVPVPVLKIGSRMRVRKADIEAYLAPHIPNAS